MGRELFMQQCEHTEQIDFHISASIKAKSYTHTEESEKYNKEKNSHH